jgi:hypothetical protein
LGILKNSQLSTWTFLEYFSGKILMDFLIDFVDNLEAHFFFFGLLVRKEYKKRKHIRTGG